MSPKNITISVVFALFLSLTACSNDLRETSQSLQNAPDGDGSERLVATQNRSLQVTDLNGSPLKGAKVLIGSGMNQPFPANFVSTNETGNFAVPSSWTTSQPVTVEADGYIRATFFGQLPKGQKFELRPTPKAVAFELKGKGLGFQVKNNDNLMDFALMMPVAKRQDLFSFDLNMFISSKSDTVTVMGQTLNLPSNISVPKQTERYGILPVTIEKLQYRMYFDALGRQQIYTLRGQFPFKQVVSEIQNGKSFTDVINHFSLKSGSLKEVTLTGTTQNFDLPVNELVFNQSRAFTSPHFNNDEVLLAAPLSVLNGALMITDLKNVPPNASFQLTTMNGESQLLIALKKKTQSQAAGAGQFSAVIVPFRAGVRPEILQMIEKPQVVDSYNVRFAAPAVPTTVEPVATYSVLSKVDHYEEAGKTYEIVTRVWESYASNWTADVSLPEWPSDVSLPEWPSDVVPTGKKRWEVTFVAAPAANKAVDLSPRILETVTHATHSASDF